MSTTLLPAFTFALIMFITPGPNTLTVASLAMQGGYMRALPFMLGAHLGIALVFATLGLAASTIGPWLSSAEPIMAIIGGIYIIFIAWKIRRSPKLDNKLSTEDNHTGFLAAILLQIVNPKTMVCAITLYSTFLVDICDQPLQVILISYILGLCTILTHSLWALASVSIARIFNSPRQRGYILNGFAISLVALAIQLVWSSLG